MRQRPAALRAVSEPLRILGQQQALAHQGLRGGLSRKASAQVDVPDVEPGSLLDGMARQIGVSLA